MRNREANPGRREYVCGERTCAKQYSSYTAFYNHCKKAHAGVLPPGTLHHNRPYHGPSKNRGRPRINHNGLRDSQSFLSQARENALIEFLAVTVHSQSPQLPSASSPGQPAESYPSSLFEHRSLPAFHAEANSPSLLPNFDYFPDTELSSIIASDSIHSQPFTALSESHLHSTISTASQKPNPFSPSHNRDWESRRPFQRASYLKPCQNPTDQCEKSPFPVNDEGGDARQLSAFPAEPESAKKPVCGERAASGASSACKERRGEGEKPTLVMYVDDPKSNLKHSLEKMRSWAEAIKLARTPDLFICYCIRLNEQVSSLDLDEFYDPVEEEKFENRLDSYSFPSIVGAKKRGLLKCRDNEGTFPIGPSSAEARVQDGQEVAKSPKTGLHKHESPSIAVSATAQTSHIGPSLPTLPQRSVRDSTPQQSQPAVAARVEAQNVAGPISEVLEDGDSDLAALQGYGCKPDNPIRRAAPEGGRSTESRGTDAAPPETSKAGFSDPWRGFQQHTREGSRGRSAFSCPGDWEEDYNLFLAGAVTIWLARFLCESLLAEVAFTAWQMLEGLPCAEQEFLSGKSQRLRQLLKEYFECFPQA